MSKNVTLTNDSLVLHSGQQEMQTLMSHYRPFGLDDFLELSFILSIDRMVFPGSKFDLNHHGLNAVFFQFSNHPGLNTHDFLAHDKITFHGLVVMLVQHNSHDEEGQNNETFFITWRNFGQRTTVHRDYVTLLFDHKRLLNRQKGLVQV